ncbi:MAG: long-chain-fatty-acid--CoA ligase [Pseudomonadota bacterium]|nr:long-chain-fatty-acid--CoA ligase [Pseudomonadota bacterium]
MNISHWIERWAAFQPDKTAIRFEDDDISYARLSARIRNAASMLRDDMSIGRNDRIAFLGLNSPDMLVLMFACARIGAVLVPLNWRLAPPEYLYILNNSGAKLLFCESDFSDDTDGISEDLKFCRIVSMGEEFDAYLAEAGDDAQNPDVGPDDPLLIVYTSGTTGRPKGAVLTQNALTFNAVNSIAMHDMTSTDIVFTNLPMFHVGGLNIQTTPALHAGAMVILHRRFDPDATVRAIREEKPTLMILVPALMSTVVQHPDWANLDLSSLRAINTGSTTVPLSLIDAYQDRGVPIIQVYGSTETAPIVIHQRIPDAWTTRGSTGRAALHCDAKIVDTDGNTLGPDERGEIVVRGPNVMTEYWNDPDSSAKVLKEGWFHTGDIGHIDENGLFYVDDRLNDIIISGSENIYPAELEMVLDKCADIAEAAVIGREDAKWGEVPITVIVVAEGKDLSKEDVLALFDGHLARFKHPHDVIFMDRLPRNAMGKVLKFELRDMVSPHYTR